MKIYNNIRYINVMWLMKGKKSAFERRIIS